MYKPFDVVAVLDIFNTHNTVKLVVKSILSDLDSCILNGTPKLLKGLTIGARTKRSQFHSVFQGKVLTDMGIIMNLVDRISCYLQVLSYYCEGVLLQFGMFFQIIAVMSIIIRGAVRKDFMDGNYA